MSNPDVSLQPKLSLDQYGQLVELLGRVDPKFPLGTQVFDEVARISPFIALELIAGTDNGGSRRKILLAKRPAVDDGWADQWAIAGTVLRVGDGTRLPHARLAKKELKSVPLKSINVTGTALVSGGGGRSPGLSIVTVGELTQGKELSTLLDQDGIAMFSPGNLPEDLIGVHRLFIEMSERYLHMRYPHGTLGLLAKIFDQASSALRRLEGGAPSWIEQDASEFPPFVVMADPVNTTRIVL